MPEPIKASEFEWKDPIVLRFSFFGLTASQAVPVIQNEMDQRWPENVRRYDQCIYVVRLCQPLAVSYPARLSESGELIEASASPVLYIGEGDAYARLRQHADWLASILEQVPQAGFEVHIADFLRRNNTSLCQNEEADLIRVFAEQHGCKPWFNRQFEPKQEGFDYAEGAWAKAKKHILAGSGKKFTWAIRPLPGNTLHDQRYAK